MADLSVGGAGGYYDMQRRACVVGEPPPRLPVPDSGFHLVDDGLGLLIAGIKPPETRESSVSYASAGGGIMVVLLWLLARAQNRGWLGWEGRIRIAIGDIRAAAESEAPLTAEDIRSKAEAIVEYGEAIRALTDKRDETGLSGFETVALAEAVAKRARLVVSVRESMETIPADVAQQVFEAIDGFSTVNPVEEYSKLDALYRKLKKNEDALKAQFEATRLAGRVLDAAAESVNRGDETSVSDFERALASIPEGVVLERNDTLSRALNRLIEDQQYDLAERVYDRLAASYKERNPIREAIVLVEEGTNFARAGVKPEKVAEILSRAAVLYIDSHVETDAMLSTISDILESRLAGRMDLLISSVSTIREALFRNGDFVRVAELDMWLGERAVEAGDLTKAKGLFENAIGFYRRQSEHFLRKEFNISYLLYQYADVLERLGDRVNALRARDEAMELEARKYGVDEPRLASIIESYRRDVNGFDRLSLANQRREAIVIIVSFTRRYGRDAGVPTAEYVNDYYEPAKRGFGEGRDVVGGEPGRDGVDRPDMARDVRGLPEGLRPGSGRGEETEDMVRQPVEVK